MAQNEITVVVPKTSSMSHDTVGVTPSNMDNISVNAMHWWQIVLIRALKTYILTMTSLIPALMGSGEHVGLAVGHSIILKAAELAIFPTVLVLLGSAGMILSQMDEKMPTAWHA